MEQVFPNSLENPSKPRKNGPITKLSANVAAWLNAWWALVRTNPSNDPSSSEEERARFYLDRQW